MKHNSAEAADLGRTLTKLHRKAGHPSYKSIERRLVVSIGELAPSDQTIANYHNGRTHPLSIHPEVLSELARFYGVSVRDLGPAVEARCSRLREMALAWDVERPRQDSNLRPSEHKRHRITTRLTPIEPLVA